MKCIENRVIDNMVCQNLKKYRVLLGITQQEIGRVIGVSPQQIQKYENCTNRISSGKLFNLAKGLNLPINLFFKG